MFLLRCSFTDNLPLANGLLDLGDGLGHVDLAGAGFRAVKGRAAAEHPTVIAEDLQTVLGSLVAGVENETMGGDNGGRAHILIV